MWRGLHSLESKFGLGGRGLLMGRAYGVFPRGHCLLGEPREGEGLPCGLPITCGRATYRWGLEGGGYS